MSEKVKVGRNEKCPCGTGEKYKNCCIDKGFTWVRDEDGTVYRSIPKPDELTRLIEEQREAFFQKHGRYPEADDPIFTEPFEIVEHHAVEAMKRAGVHPSLIYAYEKTRLIVTESSQHMIPTKDLDDYNDAIDEWYEMNEENVSEDKTRSFYVEYEVSYKGKVGPFTVTEKNGIVDLDALDEEIDSAIDKKNLDEYWSDSTTSYHCEKCGQMLDFIDDEGGRARFECGCT